MKFYMIASFIEQHEASYEVVESESEEALRRVLKEEEKRPGFIFGVVYDEKQSMKCMASRGLQNTAHLFEAVVPDMILGGHDSPYMVKFMTEERL